MTAAAADKAIDIATAYVRRVSAGTSGSRASANDSIINMLSVAAPQQVMLEVKVAEVSRTLLDKLGVEFGIGHAAGNWAFSLLSSFGRTDANGFLSAIKSSARNPLALNVDAQKDDGLVKVLAEPNVLAISGQEGSFLAGGKIFNPGRAKQHQLRHNHHARGKRVRRCREIHANRVGGWTDQLKGCA